MKAVDNLESLKNGSVVIKREGEIVLAQTDSGEWVTWCTDSEGNAFWGHYFREDFLAAVVDFSKRSNTTSHLVEYLGTLFSGARKVIFHEQ